jgi:hypothetical protein
MTWMKRHEELWGRLVPNSGQADTVQGELIRVTSRLTDEAHRNGNMNWDDGHELWCDFLEATLLDGDSFSEAELARIADALERARDFEHPDTSGHGGPLYLLSEMAVRWCDARTELIPHAHDPRLRR